MVRWSINCAKLEPYVEYPDRDGKVVLYHRGTRGILQARIKVGTGTKGWHRFSTGTDSVKEGSEIACKKYDWMMFRKDEGLTITTSTFISVARLALEEMERDIKEGYGKPIYTTYRQAINKYLIPFFGKSNKRIDDITIQDVERFNVFRKDKLAQPFANHYQTPLKR